MKRKYLIILIAVIIIEVIGIFVVISIKEKKQKNEIEVGSLENIIENQGEIVFDNETEEIRLGLIQAKQQIELRKKELQDKRNEILKNRRILFNQGISSNIVNTSDNNKNNNKNNNASNNNGNINDNVQVNNKFNYNIDDDIIFDNKTRYYTPCVSTDGVDKDTGNSIKISKIINNKRKEYNYTSEVEDLGIPLINKYPENTRAHITSRNVWDMQVFKNRVYIGSGDYSANTGPVDVYYYDTAKEEFVNEGTLQDEQINRFVIIDDNLVITGTDPRTDYDMGTYYEWNNNSWITHKTLIGTVHNFDMVKYKGKLFAGTGNAGKSNIIMSEDGGQTFSYVDMVSFDEVVKPDISNRVYDMFIYRGELYAKANVENARVDFKYNEEKNIFEDVTRKKTDSGWQTNFMLAYGNGPGLSKYVPLKTKLEYNGAMIYINGKMSIYNYDVVYAEQNFDVATYVYDGILRGNDIYILCATPVKDKYIMSVYKTTRTDIIETWWDKTEWELQLYFEYSDFARSFEYVNGSYYFGIGTELIDTDDGTNAGRILKVKMN